MAKKLIGIRISSNMVTRFCCGHCIRRGTGYSGYDLSDPRLAPVIETPVLSSWNRPKKVTHGELCNPVHPQRRPITATHGHRPTYCSHARGGSTRLCGGGADVPAHGLHGLPPRAAEHRGCGGSHPGYVREGLSEPGGLQWGGQILNVVVQHRLSYSDLAWSQTSAGQPLGR